MKNQYDKEIIKRNIPSTVPKKKEVFICLEFLGKISLQSKRQLTKNFLLSKKNVKLNVVFRSSNRIRNPFWFKDQIPKYINSKVVYKLSATSAMVFTLVKLSFIFLLVNMNILRNQYLLKRIYVYTEKDLTAIRKH